MKEEGVFGRHPSCQSNSGTHPSSQSNSGPFPNWLWKLRKFESWYRGYLKTEKQRLLGGGRAAGINEEGGYLRACT